MDELADCSTFSGQPRALRDRLSTDGYLFFRGLLPADRALAAGNEIRTKLRSGGWPDAEETVSQTPVPLDPKERLHHAAFRDALSGPEFNQLAYLPPLSGLIESILGGEAFCYPLKIVRAAYPERTPGAARGRHIHCDYTVFGVQDMLTTWLPLMEIPLEMGGLAVRPGSHLGPPLRREVLGPDEPGWASTRYRPGDVLVFHCLTAHGALLNRSTALRLSGDFRWQRADQPAPARLVLGPDGRNQELFSRQFASEPWWKPVPSQTVLIPREEFVLGPAGPSHYFPVHPSWRQWRSPGARSTSPDSGEAVGEPA